MQLVALHLFVIVCVLHSGVGFLMIFIVSFLSLLLSRIFWTVLPHSFLVCFILLMFQVAHFPPLFGNVFVDFMVYFL